MDAKKVGALIATLRKEKGMTQAELAEQLNISNRTVSKWENGDGYPDITILVPLADLLGVSTDELLCGEVQSADDGVRFDISFEETRKDIVKGFRLIQSRKMPVYITIAAYLLTGATIFCFVNLFRVNGNPINGATRILYEAVIVLLLLYTALIIFAPYLVYKSSRSKSKTVKNRLTVSSDSLVSQTDYKSYEVSLNDLSEFVINDEYYVLLFGKKLYITLPKTAVLHQAEFEAFIKPFAKTVYHPQKRLRYRIAFAMLVFLSVAFLGATAYVNYAGNEAYFYRDLKTKAAYYYDNASAFEAAMKETKAYYASHKAECVKEIAEEEYADFSESDFRFKLGNIYYVSIFPEALTFSPDYTSGFKGGYDSGYIYYDKGGLPSYSDFFSESEYCDSLEKTYIKEDNVYLFGKTKNGTVTKDLWYLIVPLADNWYYYEVH